MGILIWFSIVFFIGFFVVRFFKRNLVFRDSLKPYFCGLVVVLLLQIYYKVDDSREEILSDIEYAREEMRSYFRDINPAMGFFEMDKKAQRYKFAMEAQNRSLEYMKKYSGFFSGLDRLLSNLTYEAWSLDTKHIEYKIDSMNALDGIDSRFYNRKSYDTTLFGSYDTNFNSVIFSREILLKQYVEAIETMKEYALRIGEPSVTNNFINYHIRQHNIYMEQLQYLEEHRNNFDYDEYRELLDS